MMIPTSSCSSQSAFVQDAEPQVAQTPIKNVSYAFIGLSWIFPLESVKSFKMEICPVKNNAHAQVRLHQTNISAVVYV